jgi:hypothetical protein
LALIAGAALIPALSVVQQLGQEGWQRGGEDPLSAFDRRLAPLQHALRGEPAVGYLPPFGNLESPGGAAHFYMTRFALAPVIVLNDVQQPLVVADGVGDARRIPAHLEVARDFGDGLLLLRTRPQ